MFLFCCVFIFHFIDHLLMQRDKEREQKKRYYKEELSKLQKISDYYKMEALNSKAKIEELTDKNFDLDGQLKKQKLKNKELLLGILHSFLFSFSLSFPLYSLFYFLLLFSPSLPFLSYFFFDEVNILRC